MSGPAPGLYHIANPAGFVAPFLEGPHPPFDLRASHEAPEFFWDVAKVDHGDDGHYTLTAKRGDSDDYFIQPIEGGDRPPVLVDTNRPWDPVAWRIVPAARGGYTIRLRDSPPDEKVWTFDTDEYGAHIILDDLSGSHPALNSFNFLPVY